MKSIFFSRHHSDKRIELVIMIERPNLVDFDLEEGVGELLVEDEPVFVVDVLALGVLGDHSRFTTGQRLRKIRLGVNLNLFQCFSPSLILKLNYKYLSLSSLVLMIYLC